MSRQLLLGVITPHLSGLGWLDPTTLVDSFGQYALWGVLFIIFAECGLLLGFFLPGDTLLFSVGLLVNQGTVDYPIWLVCLILTIGAIAGNAVGYEIGYRAGPPILQRSHGRLIRPEYVRRTQAFFDRYGAPAIILARFVPIVRTLITVTAGVAQMDRRRYLLYSTLGGILWACGITLVGYFLGDIAFVRDHIEPRLDLLILAALMISIVPIGVHMVLDRRKAAREQGQTSSSSSSTPKA